MAKKVNWVRGLVLGLIIVLSPMVYRYAKPMILGPNIEKVRVKMEKYLYKKYGEEFIVDRIGIRSAVGKKFYQARIYPKSIIGTEKEGDKYYYKSSSVSIKSFGRLGGVGDSYWIVKRNDEAEKYLLSKVKEIFGERIRLKTDIEYKKTVELGKRSFYYGLKEANFKKILEEFQKDKEGYIHLETSIYIYIYLTG